MHTAHAQDDSHLFVFFNLRLRVKGRASDLLGARRQLLVFAVRKQGDQLFVGCEREILNDNHKRGGKVLVVKFTLVELEGHLVVADLFGGALGAVGSGGVVLGGGGRWDWSVRRCMGICVGRRRF